MPIYLFEVCSFGSAPLSEVRRECADEADAERVATELLRGALAAPRGRKDIQGPAVAFFFAEEGTKTLMMTLSPDGQPCRTVVQA